MAYTRSHQFAGWAFGVAAALVVGCGEDIQPEYRIRLFAPPGQMPLAGATSVTFEAVGTGYRTSTPVSPGTVPTLRLSGLNPRTLGRTTFTATVEGPAGPIAYGQSPPITLSREENLVQVAILVQQFATLAQPFDNVIIPRLAQSNVVSAMARDAPDAPRVATPVVFGSRTVDPAGIEQPARVGILYNPYLHFTTDTAVAPAATVGSSVWARSDGTIWHFGGRIEPQLDAAGQPVGGAAVSYGATAWKMGVAQYLTTVQVELLAQYTSKFPRARAAITEVPTATGGLLYVFGGESLVGEPAALTPLRSVVVINPDEPNAAAVVAAPGLTMLSARTDHSATTVTYDVPATDTAPGTTRTEVLLFGGLPAEQPPPLSPETSNVPTAVAEVFDPTAGAFTQLGADAGANRLNHAVIRLPDGRWLLACGADRAGAPPVDARIYDPYTRTFVVAPFALAKPRANAVCFAAGPDLVIAGGVDAAGATVPDAEVFDLLTFAPVGVVPAHPRYGARATPMPDGTVMVISGRERAAIPDVPSNVVEFYRPRVSR